MPKIVIQVAKFERATKDAQGRTFASKVHDTTGTKYTVPKNQPHLAGMFENKEGSWFEIYAEDKEFHGNKYKEIVTASPTEPMTPANVPASVTVQASAKDIQIWCNSMQQRAAELKAVDLWNEEACVELCEIQKRVFGRVFLGEEAQEAPVTNSGGGQSPQARAHPESTQEMSD